MPTIQPLHHWTILLFVVISDIFATELGICPVLIQQIKTRPVKRARIVSRWYDRCDWRGGCYKRVSEEYIDHEDYYENVWVLECCGGYNKEGNTKAGQPVCKPTCPSGCINGTCKAFNTCECPHGFVLLNKHECIPHCKQNCYNGRCVEPDKCSCSEGYQFINGSDNECVGKCDKLCVNGFCGAPNKCECWEGYQFKTGSTSVCEPLCSQPCENATCTSIDTCICKSGYEAIDEWSCQPICQHKCNSRGTCVEPGKCLCPDGYLPPDCSPACPESCHPGYCTQPGICSCPPSFVFKDNTCQPVCSVDCINGKCTGPDYCSCLPGYRPSHVSLHDQMKNQYCTPICQPECIGSKCTDPGKCLCDKDFTQHPEKPNVCLPSASKQLNSSQAMDKFIFKPPFTEHVNETILSWIVMDNCHELFSVMSPGSDVIEVTCNRINIKSSTEIIFLCNLTIEDEESLLIHTTNDQRTFETIATTNDGSTFETIDVTSDGSTLETIDFISSSDISSTSTMSVSTSYQLYEETTDEIPSNLIIYLLTDKFIGNADRNTCNLCAHMSDINQWIYPGDLLYLILEECPKPYSSLHKTLGSSSAFWIVIVVTSFILALVLLAVINIIRKTAQGRIYNCSEDSCQLNNFPDT